MELWEHLNHLNASTPVSRCPWAVLGDFNQILRSSQHSSHLDLDVDIAGMEDFNLALQDAELFEATAKGLAYTWRNNQYVQPISKKIDHVLFNQQWADKFPDSFCEFLDQLQSDQAPGLVSMPSIKRKVVKPFKFFHHTIDHPQFLPQVAEAWKCDSIQGSLHFKLMRSLKLLKPVLRKLNRKNYSGISLRVKDQTAKLSLLQRQLLTNPDPVTARLEHEERGKLQTLIVAEEKFYSQKSRVQWHHLGDRDTPFFHKSVVQRAHRNHIHFLNSDTDVVIGTAEDIKAHTIDYFTNTLGSTNLPESPCSVEQLQDLLPFRCSKLQCRYLQREVGAVEIKNTLFAMPLDKSPGPDGYSAEFFRST